VALFNVDGVFHALDGVCPHQGGPLGKGTLSGCIVTCPWHGWHLTSPAASTRSASHRHTRYATKVEGEEVFVSFDAW
jgi:nitrite reductase/ring-hydroxylating ferredoxin subunit